MNTTFILLGTNQGDRGLNLTTARHEISRNLGSIITASSIYKTAAWGIENQPDFFNQVIIVQTEYDPQKTLNILQKIEVQLGRTRLEKWGPRIIDIDILFFNNAVVNSSTLKIPHPEIQNRKFTLMPLIEVAEHFIHPILKKTISELLKECPDTLQVEKI